MCHKVSRDLCHIQSYSIVHYDVKPSNIFFVLDAKSGDIICKIGDFGLAGSINTRDDRQEGNTTYMSSEIISFSCTKHPSADVFSLGTALPELDLRHAVVVMRHIVAVVLATLPPVVPIVIFLLVVVVVVVVLLICVDVMVMDGRMKSRSLRRKSLQTLINHTI